MASHGEQQGTVVKRGCQKDQASGHPCSQEVAGKELRGDQTQANERPAFNQHPTRRAQLANVGEALDNIDSYRPSYDSLSLKMAGPRTTILLSIPFMIIGYLLSGAPYNMVTLPPQNVWADGPMKLIATPQFQTKKTDLFTAGATHMALLHNSILRGYNSIFNQASLVLEQDKTDFIGYSLAWHKFVKSHHDDEEQTLFTKIEELLKDDKVFEETHKEHEAFLAGLAEFEKYLTGLKTPADFSGEELLKIMKGFQAPFESHFHSEISTIAKLADHPNTPKEGTPEQAAASLTFKTWGKSTVTKAGVMDVVPFFLLNLDRTVEDGMWSNWPPMPAPIKWGLINIAGSWHSGWWKFASCNAAGQPRELWAFQAAALKAEREANLKP